MKRGIELIFNERLSELRKETNLNQKDFASSLDLEPSKYNKWENGKTVPDFDTVILLARHLGVTVDYLIGNSDVRTWENADIRGKTGLDEKSIIKLNVLKELSSESPDFRKSVLERYINHSGIDVENSPYKEIMDANIKVDIDPSMVLNAFISGFNFMNFFSDFCHYIRNKILLTEYEKWAMNYLHEAVEKSDDLFKLYLGEQFDLDITTDTIQVILDYYYSAINLHVCKSNNLNSDIEYLSFNFYSKMQRYMESILIDLSENTQNTIWYKLHFEKLSEDFKKELKSYI